MDALREFVRRAAKVGTQVALQAVSVAEHVVRLSRDVFDQFAGRETSPTPPPAAGGHAEPPSARPDLAAASSESAPLEPADKGAPAAASAPEAASAPPVPARWRLEKMKKAELLELCKAHGLDCNPEMPKRQLVEELAKLAPRRRHYRMSGAPLPSPVTLLKRPRHYLEKLCAEHGVECPPDERKRFIINRLYEKVTGAPPDWERFGEPAHPSR